jgi:hypothetical protein
LLVDRDLKHHLSLNPFLFRGQWIDGFHPVDHIRIHCVAVEANQRRFGLIAGAGTGILQSEIHGHGRDNRHCGTIRKVGLIRPLFHSIQRRADQQGMAFGYTDVLHLAFGVNDDLKKDFALYP